MNETLTIILQMTDPILSWIFDHFPILAICLTMLVIAFLLAWWLRGWLDDYRNRFVKVEVDVAKIEPRLTTVESRLTNVESRLTKVESDIVQLNANQIIFGKRLTRVESKLDHLIAIFKAGTRNFPRPS